MSNISAIGDATGDGSAIIVQPTNSKITYNGIKLCLLGAIIAPHLTHGSPTIVNTIQTKITVNGVPFSIYGSIVSCGTTIIGSGINPKISITP